MTSTLMSIRMDGSSLATPERQKREEMFETTTRFILALRRRPEEPLPSEANSEPSDQRISDGSVRFESDDLLGYCSFRFDTEETQKPKDAEVIYW